MNLTNISLNHDCNRYPKARATTLIGYEITGKFSEKKVHGSQVSNGIKNRLGHKSFYHNNIERLLHNDPEDSKKKQKLLKVITNKAENSELVNF